MGRRSFVQTIGAIGLTTGSALGSEKRIPGGPEYDPRERVPRVHALRHVNQKQAFEPGVRPKREPVYGLISREKWRMVEAAFRARRRIERRLSDLSPTPTVVVRHSEEADDEARRTIVVKHVIREDEEGNVVQSPGYSLSKLRDVVKERFPESVSAEPRPTMHRAAPPDEIPGLTKARSVSGMPLRIEETKTSFSSHSGTGAYYNYDYHDPGLPAGCLIEAIPDRGYGTLGTPASDWYGNPVMVTAGHLLEDPNGTANVVYQNDYSEPDDNVGTPRDSMIDYGQGFDAGVIDNLQYPQKDGFASDWGSNSYKIPTILGIRTQTWVQDNQGGKYITKQGCTTGTINNETIADVNDENVWIWHEEDGGDSGGPYYDVVDYDNAYIIGIHKSPSIPYSAGTLMEAIENRWFLTV